MSRNDRKGFTLFEVLVAMVVVAMLAGLVGPMIFRNVSDARTATARAQIQMLGLALDSYRLDVGQYPTTEQGLEALRRQPRDGIGDLWRGPYLKRDVPFDPWKKAYQYRSPGTHDTASYDLLTLGRDGREGGSGEDEDVTSW